CPSPPSPSLRRCRRRCWPAIALPRGGHPTTGAAAPAGDRAGRWWPPLVGSQAMVGRPCRGPGHG
ncbi:hypothetical protein BHE74_00039560, partial [Ensete ventricosum]